MVLLFKKLLKHLLLATSKGLVPLAWRMKAYDFSVLWRTFGVLLAYPWRTRRTLGVPLAYLRRTWRTLGV